MDEPVEAFANMETYLRDFLNVETLQLRMQELLSWLMDTVFVWTTVGQVATVVGAFVFARLAAPRLRGWIEARAERRQVEPRLRRIATAMAPLTLPVIWLILQWISVQVAAEAEWPRQFLRIVVSLLAAWVIIRLTSTLVSDPVWSRLIAAAAWTIAALNILRLLDPTIALLDGLAMSLGGVRLSVLTIIKGILSLAVLLWLASLMSSFLDRRVQALPRLTPSVQLLFSKLLKIVLFAAAILIGMSSIGIDITAFTVFSGAVGVGIGFGLQAVFSNFVAGLIILLEKSLKVGDFVDLESGITGEVREINIRSTVVTTNDNIDILVPNSEFVNGRVTNWTLRDAFRRIRVPFGVAYGTDKELVRKAGLEAAANVPHTLTSLTSRAPQVWLVGFGDSSLNFELVVWLVPEAIKSPGKVHAAYCWELETALAKYGIEIPFPQRDLHIRSSEALTVFTGAAPRPGGAGDDQSEEDTRRAVIQPDPVGTGVDRLRQSEPGSDL